MPVAITAADTGSKAITYLRLYEADIIVIDTSLPGIDEITAFLREGDTCAGLFALSPAANTAAAERAESLGAIYYGIEPIPAVCVCDRIQLMLRRGKHDNNPLILDQYANRRMKAILQAMGAPLTSKGIHYINQALTMLYRNPQLLFNLCNQVYPDIGAACRDATRNVERSIRYSIQLIWKGMNPKMRVAYFPRNTQPPSNKLFLTVFLRQLEED